MNYESAYMFYNPSCRNRTSPMFRYIGNMLDYFKNEDHLGFVDVHYKT